MKQGGQEIFRLTSSETPPSILDQALGELLGAFKRGVVEVSGNRLSYINREAKVTLDIKQRTFTKQYHNMVVTKAFPPSASQIVEVTDQFVMIYSIPENAFNSSQDVFNLP